MGFRLPTGRQRQIVFVWDPSPERIEFKVNDSMARTVAVRIGLPIQISICASHIAWGFLL